MAKKLLEDLMHFPNQTYNGQLSPTDFWVSPDMMREYRESLKKSSPDNNCLANTLYGAVILGIAHSKPPEIWVTLKETIKSGRVCVVHSHAGTNWPGQDGKWRYNVGNGEYPLVADLFGEIDTLGFDLVFLDLCNGGKYRLSPNRTPVIHPISVPHEKPLEYVLIRP